MDVSILGRRERMLAHANGLVAMDYRWRDRRRGSDPVGALALGAQPPRAAAVTASR